MTHKSKDDVHPHFVFTTFKILTYFVGYVSNNQFLLPRNIFILFQILSLNAPLHLRFVRLRVVFVCPLVWRATDYLTVETTKSPTQTNPAIRLVGYKEKKSKGIKPSP